MGAEAGPYTRLYKRVNHFFVSSIMRTAGGFSRGVPCLCLLLAHSRAPDYFLPARIPAGAGAGRHLSGPLHQWPLPVVNQDSSNKY